MAHQIEETRLQRSVLAGISLLRHRPGPVELLLLVPWEGDGPVPTRTDISSLSAWLKDRT
jgi:hypothetical protein